MVVLLKLRRVFVTAFSYEQGRRNEMVSAGNGLLSESESRRSWAEYQDAIAEVIASRVGELLHILVVQYQLCRIRTNDETFLLAQFRTTSVTRMRVFISFETMVESSDEPIQWAVSVQG